MKQLPCIKQDAKRGSNAKRALSAIKGRNIHPLVCAKVYIYTAANQFQVSRQGYMYIYSDLLQHIRTISGVFSMF